MARLRAAAVPPLVAFLGALVYFTLYPLLPRVPAVLFWTMAVVVLAGAVAGIIGIARVVCRERIRGRAIGWLVVACAITLLCARLFLSLTLPWL